MLTTEWNEEQAMEVRAREGRKEGREEGLDIGAAIIRALIDKEPIENIAARHKVSIERVKQIQTVLAQLPA